MLKYQMYQQNLNTVETLYRAELCRETGQLKSQCFLQSGKVICPAVNFALHCKGK